MDRTFCAQCGAEIQIGANFCSNCGCYARQNTGYLSKNRLDSLLFGIKESTEEFLSKYADTDVYDKLISDKPFVLSDCGAKLYCAETDISVLLLQKKGEDTELNTIVTEINYLLLDISNESKQDQKKASILKKQLEKEEIKKRRIEDRIKLTEEKVQLAIKKRDEIIKHIRSINSITITAY